LARFGARNSCAFLQSVQPVALELAGQFFASNRSSGFPKGSNREENPDSRRSGGVNDLNVLALIKGNERFVYVYDDGSRDAVIDSLRDQAADPDVSLNWFDAAVLTERARHQATRSDGPMPSRI
jgi:hypothetical protein